MIAVAKKSNLRFFYGFLALALISRVLSDIFVIHRWGIHGGELFPYRYGLIPVPLYPRWVLIIEWGMLIVGSAMVLLNRIRWGVALMALGLTMSLTQMFQNQKALILIVLLALNLELLSDKNQKEASVKNFLQWQLILIYFFSAFHKILGPFAQGEVLQVMTEKILHLPINFNTSTFMVLSWVIIVAELVAPLLLFFRPRLGVILVVGLHVGRAAIMPDILAFSFVMIALSILFLDKNYFFSKSE